MLFLALSDSTLVYRWVVWRVGFYMTLYWVPFIQTSTLAHCELVVWGIGILALLLSISSQFHSFTKPNSIMKITDSSFAILLLSLSASAAAAAMSTLPDGGQRHQLQAFTTASNTRGGGTQINAPRCHGWRTIIRQRLFSMESEDDGDIQLPMSRNCITGEWCFGVVSSYSHVCNHVISCITDTTFSIYADASTTVVTHKCKAETTSGVEGSETKVEDEIEFEVLVDDDDDGGGICIKVKYEQEIEDEAADTEQETQASFIVCFQQLIEYSKQEGSADEA